MTFEAYLAYTETLLNETQPAAPYSDPMYMKYTQLNFSRMKRWIKKAELTSETVKAINSLDQQQKWIVISEPWCGDAAHSLPIIAKMAELNKHIQLEIQLRDSKESEIDNYLTNGGKSIPKLIIRNANGNDIAVWGPRPEKAQELHNKLKTEQIPMDELIVQLQNWYNEDQGMAIQREIIKLLNKKRASD